jgi:hypothetical protein
MQIEFIIKQIKLPKIRKNTIHNLRNKILCDDCSSFSSGPANAQLMLNNIRLELRGYVAITELTVNVEKLLKRCCLCVWLNQLCLKLLSSVMEVVIMLLLNDHVLHDHTSNHHFIMSWTTHVLAGWKTISHRAWGTPNVRSTSFIQASCFWKNLFIFSIVGS